MMAFGRCLIFVTGASRGFGTDICQKFAQLASAGSVMVGMARSAEGLNKTRQIVKDANSGVEFVPVKADLSVELDGALDKSVNLAGRIFDTVFVIHNAGSLGELSYLHAIEDFKETQNYFTLNVSSVLVLNTKLLNMVKGLSPTPKVYVINISSLAGLSPFKSWGLYCTGKAARDMLFKVLATERTDINVLSYAPGALDTDMQVAARTETQDPEMKKLFQSMKEEGKYVDRKKTVEKLVKLLTEGKYKSGDHVDFYDEL